MNVSSSRAGRAAEATSCRVHGEVVNCSRALELRVLVYCATPRGTGELATGRKWPL